MSSYAPVSAIRQIGTTMIELVISITVISTAIAGVLVVMSRTMTSSADPIIEYQAVAIAESYMEEIMLQAFDNPGGGETGGPEAGETRATYDDVSDYNGLTDNGARDQAGNAIAGLGAYTVNVTVTGNALGGIAAANSRRVEITVTTQFGTNVALGSYRTNF